MEAALVNCLFLHDIDVIPVGTERIRKNKRITCALNLKSLLNLYITNFTKGYK